MTSEPLVSIVTIFWNPGPFLEEAIESVYAQTYREWELLLVNDGSTDESIAVAREHAARDPDRVRYLEHAGRRNLGMSASRNLGIRHARGEYVALLDADDVWLPAKLAEQVAVLEANPDVAMVYGATEWWYSWTARPEDRERDFVHDLGVPANTVIRPPTLLTRLLADEGMSPCTCSMLLRRDALDRVGGFEDAFRGLYEDQVLAAKICLDSAVLALDTCSYRYRQHPASSTATADRSGARTRARAAFLAWLAAYLEALGVDDPDLWRVVRTERKRLRRSRLGDLITRPRPWAAVRAVAGRSISRTGGRHPDLLRDSRLLVGQGIGAAWRRALPLTRLPVIRQARCFQLRRLGPLSNGRPRGTPIVRFYWAEYLERHRADVRGRALEIGTTETLRRYGGPALLSAEAFDVAPWRADVTVVADLARADDVPSDRYDCFVVPFTMHVIYDVEAALYHAMRILKPGGVLLVNFPCVDHYFADGLDMGTGTSLYPFHWFTPLEVDNLFRRLSLGDGDYDAVSFGNLFARIAYQLNMAAEELTDRELAHRDPRHPLLVCARAVKPAGWSTKRPEYRDPWTPTTRPRTWTEERGHYG